jgi:hypothetical protein
MQADTMFKIDGFHLPLSVMVGITNTGKAFPLAFAFITSESAEAFGFINAQLAELVWYDCPPPQIILADQSKGLGTAAIAASNVQDRSGQVLQLSEAYVVQSIQNRLIDSDKYAKERMGVLIRLIWNYALSSNETELAEQRRKLLAELHEPDRRHLQENWEPKERQFVRAYTRRYPNLGCNGTNHNVDYYAVLEESLNRQLPLQEACQKLAESLKNLATRIIEEDQNRVSLPRLLDRSAFRHLLGAVPHYVLDMLDPEWEAAKAQRWRQDVMREEKLEALRALDGPGCPLACELPLRYGLPCRHWMYEAVVRASPIPLSLVHPRWLLNGPAVVRKWTMTYRDSENQAVQSRRERSLDGCGSMVLQSALEMVQVHGRLTGRQAEEFAKLFCMQNDRLIADFRIRTEASRRLPSPSSPESTQDLTPCPGSRQSSELPRIILETGHMRNPSPGAVSMDSAMVAKTTVNESRKRTRNDYEDAEDVAISRRRVFQGG